MGGRIIAKNKKRRGRGKGEAFATRIKTPSSGIEIIVFHLHSCVFLSSDGSPRLKDRLLVVINLTKRSLFPCVFNIQMTIQIWPPTTPVTCYDTYTPVSLRAIPLIAFPFRARLMFGLSAHGVLFSTDESINSATANIPPPDVDLNLRSKI